MLVFPFSATTINFSAILKPTLNEAPSSLLCEPIGITNQSTGSEIKGEELSSDTMTNTEKTLEVNPVQLHECQHCDLAPVPMSYLQAHIVRRHKPNRFYCKKCTVDYGDEELAITHEKHCSRRAYTCDVCRDIFHSETAYKDQTHSDVCKLKIVANLEHTFSFEDSGKTFISICFELFAAVCEFYSFPSFEFLLLSEKKLKMFLMCGKIINFDLSTAQSTPAQATNSSTTPVSNIESGHNSEDTFDLGYSGNSGPFIQFV